MCACGRYVYEQQGLLLAADEPPVESNEARMKGLLNIFPVQVIQSLVLHTHIYALSDLLHRRNAQFRLANAVRQLEALKNWDSNLRSKGFGLSEHGWDADIESDIVFVNKFAGFSCDKAHHLGADRGERASVVFAHISRIIAGRSEHSVRCIGY